MRAIVLALAVALLGAAGPSHAATVVQMRSLSHYNAHSVIGNRGQIALGTALYKSAHDDIGSFDAFDPALGTLTGVQITLASTQTFYPGVRTAPPAYIYGLHGLEQQLTFGSTVLASRRWMEETECPIGRLSEPCFQAYSDEEGSWDWSATLTDWRVFEDSPSPIGFGVDSLLFVVPRLAEVQGNGGILYGASLSWDGTATLTYRYDPAPLPGGVPEPATWVMLTLGFGAIGGAMRRRRVRSPMRA